MRFSPGQGGGTGDEETGLPLAFSQIHYMPLNKVFLSGPQLCIVGAGLDYFFFFGLDYFLWPLKSSQPLALCLGEPWFKVITSFGPANTYLRAQPWWLLWGARELRCKGEGE